VTSGSDRARKRDDSSKTPDRAEARRRGRLAALAGVAAAVAALGIAEVVGIAAGARATPIVSVGGVVIDNVPEWGKEFAIRLFGTHDKFALQIGTLIILMACAAAIGVLALRNRWYGVVGVGLFGVVGLVAALTRADATWTAIFPSIIGAGAGIYVLHLLIARIPGHPGTRIDRRADQDDARRTFVRIAGVTIAVSVVGGLLGRFLATRRNVEAQRRATVLPSTTDTPGSPGDVNNGVTPFVTSNDDFYLIDTAIVKPQVDPRDWTLRIHGRVKHPRTITWNELLGMATIERYITLTCVSNEVGGDLIGNALWLGVPIKPILQEAEPLPDADQLVSRSVDGFTAGTPTAVMLDGRDAILAIGMNGEPLPIDHGFPVRQVVPGLYGYVSATKWLSEWELTRFSDFDAYWVPRGWSQQAPIKTESRIDTPGEGARFSAGTRTVAGVAWAQHRGISKVEVRVDKGEWQPATLFDVPSIDTWRLWSWQWEATQGKHTLQVRATDNAGAAQTEDEAPPPPDGASGYHTITVTVS
jgi:DMSO/TMAO reductase YedYZ molybdopterin-dependent catalytic subunit